MMVKLNDIITLAGDSPLFTYKVVEANGDRYLVQPVEWVEGIAPLDLIFSHHIEKVITNCASGLI